ncbi:hypothetical protein TL16_g05138 [Triparma laevis f. inornata]|uniref:Uncharacterized protein n=1 Tax=Triparma laevis f. inornata TaxID=1714386 RepID=A0A9W7AH76_9STRA|nr:hypothetical protein TL16_g05138 [Triparma laevis f. inornata]
MEEEQMSRFLLTIFRRGVPGLVPIVYLSAESLGCLLGQTPDFSNENMEILEIIESGNAKFKTCVGMISANHAMGFHLSMLLTVSLFVLPFETSMSVQDIKNFNLNLHHQTIFGMIFSSSLVVVYLFATRVESEDLGGEAFERDLTVSNFLINIVHLTWAVAFVSFGFDALAKSKEKRTGLFPPIAGSTRSMEELAAELAAENSFVGKFALQLQKKPFWNRFLGSKGKGKDKYSFAPIYHIIALLASLVVPVTIFLRFAGFEDGSSIFFYFGPTLLALHAALGGLLGISDVRRPGYPWRELAIFAINPLTLTLAGLNEAALSGWTMFSFQAFSAAFLLMLFWPLAEKARRMLRDLPDDVLEKHMNGVFATSGKFMSPILFISLEALNCPVNNIVVGEGEADIVCDGIVVPCATMAFHICATMTFKANFAPHFRFEAAKLMNLDSVDNFRKTQLGFGLLATISAVYMYATRAELDVENDDLAWLRSLGFSTVCGSWAFIFTIEVFAIWAGWEEGGTTTTVEGGAMAEGGDGAMRGERTESTFENSYPILEKKKVEQPKTETEGKINTVALSKPYLVFFWALLLAGSVVIPTLHVISRSYYSFLIIYSTEVPLLIIQVLLFAATPKAHTENGLRLVCAPYLAFNLLWILATVIAMARGEEFATDTADMTMDIGIRIGTIAAACLFYPTIVDTSVKLKQFKEGKLETLMFNVFSKFAAGILLPVMYFSFEACGEIAFYHDSKFAESRRLEAETSVKTAHSLSFHLMASWSLLLFVFPFKKVATAKELYMFKLSLFSRLQFIAGFIGTSCSLLLFAMRWAFAWDIYQQSMLFIVKTTWVIIVLAESWMIKIQTGDRATTNNFGVGGGGEGEKEKEKEDGVQEKTMLELIEM